MPGAAFGLNSMGTSCQFEFEGYWISTGSTCCLQAPLNLPEASTVTEFVATYLDLDAGVNENFEIELRRKDMRNASDSEELTQIFSVEDPEIQMVSNAVSITVDAQNFSYFVDFCFQGSNNRFYGSKIVLE